MSFLLAVRGAIDVPEDTPEAITQAVQELMTELIRRNQIQPETVVSLFFTTTPDIHSLNPATALRQCLPNWNRIPLLCAQEPVIQDMFPLCIRVLLQWQLPEAPLSPPTPVYSGKAEQLRPDLPRS
jgi:chorismate mutase